METTVQTDIVEWSERDVLETVPDINKNKLTIIQHSKTTNMPVRKIESGDAWQCQQKNRPTPTGTDT